MGDNVSGLFSTKPSQQQALGILEQEVYPFAMQQAGFISMNLHQTALAY